MSLFLTVTRGQTLQDAHPVLTISDPTLIEQMLREIPYLAEYCDFEGANTCATRMQPKEVRTVDANRPSDST